VLHVYGQYSASSRSAHSQVMKCRFVSMRIRSVLEYCSMCAAAAVPPDLLQHHDVGLLSAVVLTMEVACIYRRALWG
jgi:hypothetical protein